ncbi:CRISP/Allergen/PR-1-like isoform X2 [Convolutriloba macropyga]|uniref:CRISP/Allergen/PR-1-like isoform X2 n=1 Tax=Convolutriloba macropyga TaxID=536237 RepID=UPI003F527FE0
MQKAPFILWEISMLLPCMVWTRFSRVDERECLNIHNCNRVSVTGLNDHFLNRMDEPCDMKEMLWSPCLAQMAQIHADSEILEHWDGVFGHKRWDFSTGQNIWWSPSRREPCGKQCAEAVGSWRSEMKNLDKSSGKLAGKVKRKSPDEVILHLQQLMWANTSYVGCAAGGRSMCVVVCNYWPPVVIPRWKRRAKFYRTGRGTCCPWKYEKKRYSNLCKLQDRFKQQYKYDTEDW